MPPAIRPEAPASTAATRGLWLTSLILGLISIPVIFDRLGFLPLRVALNPNEGWNALHTRAWLAGRALYLNPTGPVLNNYPPLSFGVVALLSRFTGDLIVAGRILSFVSLGALCVTSGLIARQLSGQRTAGWLAAMLVLGTFAVGYTNYVGMNDPQIFALALSTIGLWVLLRGWGSDRALVSAMLLMLLAGLTKHNMIALPIALVIALAMESPRRATMVALGGGLLTLVALGVIAGIWGTESVRSFMAGRQWQALFLGQNIIRGLPILAVPLAVVLAGAGLIRRQGPDLMLLTYVVTAWTVGLLTSGGAGVYYNCFFDAAVATCILAAVVMTRAVLQSP